MSAVNDGDGRRYGSVASRAPRLRRWRLVLLSGALAVGATALGDASPAIAQPVPGQGADGPVAEGDVAALRAALAAGGVVEVSDGEFVLDEPLTADSPGTVLRATSPGATTLRFDGSRGRVLDVTAPDVTVDGLVITGGDQSNGTGGGIRVARGASLTLFRSHVTGNAAREGGGIHNLGEIRIESSTIDANTAAKKGGGLLDDGSAEIVNSTFVGNRADQGGAVSSPGSTDITHATIVRNVATSSSSAGIDRNGGTLRVRYSIVADNLRTGGSGASDCSGTPELVELNLVSDDSGCNPVGAVIVAPPLLGPLTDNGGPTPTVAVLEDSAALDAIALDDDGRCVSGIAEDQRGTARPAGEGCELGAHERGRLGVDLDLAVDTAHYEAPPYDLPSGVVEVGAVSVPAELIAGELAARTATSDDGTIDSSSLRSIGLAAIGDHPIPIEEIGLDASALDATSLRSIDLKASSLRSISLRSISLRSISLRSIDPDATSLRSISLRSIPLSEIPLGLAGGWEELLAGTDFAGVPLQSITLEDIVGVLPDDPELTLADIDLSNTSLRSISLRSILLAGVSLRSIPLPLLEGESAPGGDYSAVWCAALFGSEACSGELVEQVGDAQLWEAQLAGGDLDQPRILEVPLDSITSTSLRSISLRSISLRSIFLENTSLRSISLRSISLRSIDDVTLDTIIDCSAASDPCSTDPSNTLTLGDVVEGCLPLEVLAAGRDDGPGCLLRIDPVPTMGQLLDVLSVDVDGVDLLEGLTLFDVLFAFLAPDDVPWEVVDLDGALLQNIAEPLQPTFDYVARVSVEEGPADLDVEVILPNGFAVAAGAGAEPATWCPVGDDAGCTSLQPLAPSSLGAPGYRLSGVDSGTYELRVPARAGLVVGPAEDFPATATVVASGPNGDPPIATAGPVGVEVVETAEGGAGRASIVDEGELRLGHLATSGDIDLYSFVAPQGTTGASARVLLSNIPAGVDYDLAVYGPRPASLRGEPTRSRSGLGDGGYDLDPSDDVLPTDVVDDIAIDLEAVSADVGDLDLPSGVEYALRDISARRSNNDEEVVLPALVAGDTYVVAVTTYYGGLSADPYGLRIRLDRRDALGECAAWSYPAASPAPPVPDGLSIDAATNALFVTAGGRLDHQAAATDDGTSTSDIVESIESLTGVNGVQPGLLYVDDLAEWDAWNADPCDPDARNAVVRAIGDAIDDAVDASGATIDSLVIVGGDGVVPMAAVVDLTEYSNESTFAGEVLSDDGASNPVAGALGSGHLLTDDPYASRSGISVRGGDHELYVPSIDIGRLVETTSEIRGQLDRFAEYDGMLDPATFTSAAAVTGYDFLDDGARQAADELTAGGFQVESLFGGEPLWDRDDYLGLLAGDDFSVVSPNAHYDFESLLPAAPDAAGYFTDDQLVTTADVSALGSGSLLAFTVGCHGGLNVDDVELGLAGTLDWAQSSARAGNQWIAHTTYGYGDTEIVAYSERLASSFAEQLAAMTTGAGDAPASLGAAVRYAKQRYVAGTLVLTPYDEKIVQSWTYYGLPMYTMGAFTDGATAGVGAESGAPSATTTGPVRFGDPAADGVVSVDIDLAGDELQRVDVGADGSYYTVGGDTIVAHYRPVQPLVDVPIPADGTYQGFLITGLSSEDLPSDHVPFSARPMIDDSDNEGRIVVADGAFPATLQRVSDDEDGQRLLVAAGQYESGQRLYRQISGELLPTSAGGDDVAPRFLEVEGRRVADVGTNGRGVQFDILTDDTAERVVVLFLEAGLPSWRSVELVGRPGPEGTTRWFGSDRLVGALGASVEFFAQSVDTAGNVGITSNKIENFLASEEGDLEADVQITYVGDEATELDGRFYASGARFAIEPADDSTRFSIDSGRLIDYDAAAQITVVFDEEPSDADYEQTGVLLLDRGPHVLYAEDDAGNRVYRFFILDPDAPEVTFAPSTSGWTSGEVELLVSAEDGAGAGVASITTTVCTGSICDAPVVHPGDETTLTVSIPAGSTEVTTVSAVATDEVGNESEPTSTDIQIDRTPPSVSFQPDGSEWSAGSVDVVVTAGDGGSGVASITTSRCRDGSCDDPVTTAGEEATVTVGVPPGEAAVTAVVASATDVVGNASEPQQTMVRIDNAPPTVSTFAVTPDADGDGRYDIGEAVSVSFSCDDEGSGVASCELLDGSEVVATSSPVALDTSDTRRWELAVRAVDGVGNETVSDVVAVVVAYRTCLLYDPTQPKNIGSNYTITVQLCDADGNNVSSNRIPLTALTIDGTTDPGPNFSGNANSGYEFRFVRKMSAYIYNLDTSGGSPGEHLLYFTTEPVPSRDVAIDELQALATNAAPFALR